MKLVHATLCCIIVVSVFDQVSCNVEDFLRKLPYKIKNAFEDTWRIIKNTFNPETKYKGKASRTRKHTTVTTSTLTTRQPILTTYVKKKPLNLPLLPVPRSRYQYMWRVPPVSYYYELSSPAQEVELRKIKTVPTSSKPDHRKFRKIVRNYPEALEKSFDYELYSTTPYAGRSEMQRLTDTTKTVANDAHEIMSVNLIRLNKTMLRLITKWELKIE